jgi:hypothetical protein
MSDKTAPRETEAETEAEPAIERPSVEKVFKRIEEGKRPPRAR